MIYAYVFMYTGVHIYCTCGGHRRIPSVLFLLLCCCSSYFFETRSLGEPGARSFPLGCHLLLLPIVLTLQAHAATHSYLHMLGTGAHVLMLVR